VIETSIETAVAERVKTTRERHRFRMSSMGSVVSGVRRVRIAFDDVDIADALLDETVISRTSSCRSAAPSP